MLQHSTIACAIFPAGYRGFHHITRRAVSPIKVIVVDLLSALGSSVEGNRLLWRGWAKSAAYCVRFGSGKAHTERGRLRLLPFSQLPLFNISPHKRRLLIFASSFFSSSPLLQDAFGGNVSAIGYDREIESGEKRISRLTRLLAFRLLVVRAERAICNSLTHPLTHSLAVRRTVTKASRNTATAAAAAVETKLERAGSLSSSILLRKISNMYSPIQPCTPPAHPSDAIAHSLQQCSAGR